ncbi:YifB family Mg chelatase-like AAA ATPase [Thermosediminibacter litoriperuensis]|uniref:Magnesium chelatase family protein n=1 Tax=Thermosediminibacter litoriperuensis TaxID=291989 RepID=A0A5S5AZ07_9FIRM|nr:YifB family Mg chelatase-like AAA ATPase [Thermosediminibacter litoriperuensis]TYP59945.1 magnesium chelatase family protein [Thermosediminibacter litoriperuensis]
MLASLKSCAIYGLDSFLVDVEVDISSGLPAFDIVGLPDTAVKESRERVRAAIKNQNFDFPVKRITLNLAPADIKKEGPHFDLPIALGILAATEQIPAGALQGYSIVGELSLDGRVRPVNGVLPMVIEVKQKNLRGIVVPFENAEEGAVIKGIEVIGVKNLKEAVEFFKGEFKPENFKPKVQGPSLKDFEGDFSEVKGQEVLKRCLEIAAAGHHNVMMVGSPGSGKTMIARRIPTILPSMTFEESLELTKIYSIAGLLSGTASLIENRPFRAPHHSISAVGLVGGGRVPKPGEVSLAHHGVLFLDELPEFSREILELLRQPLEDGKITIARINATVTYPARFMLIGAMNPCPCGYFGDPFHECSCPPQKVHKYLSKISGPLLDRIDLQVEASPVTFSDFEKVDSTDSATIRKRVERARAIQLERYKGRNIFYNSQLTPAMMNTYCKLGKAEKLLMKEAFHRLKLSGRAYNRVLKVARTIADLDQSENIKERHLAEALQYRNLDRYFQNLRF